MNSSLADNSHERWSIFFQEIKNNKICCSGLKLRVRNENLIFLVLNQNICCGYSKEPSQWDGSFEHPKHMLKLMCKKIFTFLHWKNCFLRINTAVASSLIKFKFFVCVLSKSTFSKKNLSGIPSVSSSLDPDHAQHFVGPNLGPTYLPGL